MKKHFFKSVILVVILSLALFGFAACSDDEEPNDGKFQAVDAGTINVIERDSGVFVSWGAVDQADSYVVTCNKFKTEVPTSYINMSQQDGFSLPADGVFNFTIVAKSYGYTDSNPVKYTYRATGVALNSPQIRSFDGGVLEWGRVTGAATYKVSVNGTVVSENYSSTTLDTSAYTPSSNGILKVEISAKSNNSMYLKDSPSTMVGVDTIKNRLTLLPVEKYELNDGVISWQPVGGASAYRIVDFYGNVAKTIKATEALSYDMNGFNLISGIFPVSSDSNIADAAVSLTDIKYLDGEGTSTSPYLIKKAFDLRAVDYYEFKYAEALKNGETPAQNYYRIENNINYNSVAALDDESNLFTLSQPFYGVLDGNFKKLSNIRVIHNGGYWALFDYITENAIVRNMTWESAEIVNELQKPDLPIGCFVAAIARFNYGTIQGITLKDARFSTMAGSVSGICTNNFGTVKSCEVSGEFIQVSIEALATEDDPLLFNQACFEMGGIVLENYGEVSNNHVADLTIRGNSVKNIQEIKRDANWNIVQIIYGDPYNNVRCCGGVVAVNRAGGVVAGNSYEKIDFVKVNGDFRGQEFGGLVAYNAGEISYSDSQIGKFTCTDADTVGSAVTQAQGTSSNHRGTVVGKSDGTVKKG